MRLSVVLPVYNGETHIEQAVESVLHQSFEDFELIIVDDGSTDQTVAKIQGFDDSRIRLVQHSSNQGLIAALNAGLEQASGEFIARMDHDDWCEPHRFDLQLQALEESGADLCGCAIQTFGIPRASQFVYPPSDLEIRASLAVATPFAHPGVVMRRSLGETLIYQSSAQHFEDYELWWRLLAVGKAVNLLEPLLHYRVHGGQISSLHRTAQHQGMAKTACAGLLDEGRFRQRSDLDLHVKALSYAQLDSLAQLADIGEWLQWLRQQYQIQSRYVERDYHRVWRGLCARQQGLGLGLLSVYHQYGHTPSGRKDWVGIALAATGLGGQDSKFIKTLRRVTG